MKSATFPLMSTQPTVLQLIASRYEQGSPLITSNLNFACWAEACTDDDVAVVTIDRLMYHAEVLILEGEFYRTRTRSDVGKPHATSNPCVISSALVSKGIRKKIPRQRWIR